VKPLNRMLKKAVSGVLGRMTRNGFRVGATLVVALVWRGSLLGRCRSRGIGCGCAREGTHKGCPYGRCHAGDAWGSASPLLQRLSWTRGVTPYIPHPQTGLLDARLLRPVILLLAAEMVLSTLEREGVSCANCNYRWTRNEL
jgi:hypothetical protein